MDKFLDPETIKLILKVAVPLMEELVKKIQENQGHLREILKKLDQLVLREINSGFDTIQEAMLAESIETRNRLLGIAEGQLIKNTGLELNGKIGDMPNAYWVGLANFGLFTIGKVRGEHALAARYVLKTFAADPRTARAKHFPGVYEAVFFPKLAAEQAWYAGELKKADDNKFENKIALQRAGVVGLGLLSGGSVVLGLFSRNGAAIRAGAKGFTEIGKNWEEITPEKCRQEAKQKLAVEYEGKLDVRCQALAVSWL